MAEYKIQVSTADLQKAIQVVEEKKRGFYGLLTEVMKKVETSNQYWQDINQREYSGNVLAMLTKMRQKNDENMQGMIEALKEGIKQAQETRAEVKSKIPTPGGP